MSELDIYFEGKKTNNLRELSRGNSTHHCIMRVFVFLDEFELKCNQVRSPERAQLAEGIGRLLNPSWARGQPVSSKFLSLVYSDAQTRHLNIPFDSIFFVDDPSKSHTPQ